MRKYLKSVVGAVFAALILLASAGPAMAGDFTVGTWKTAQTIQPFFYQEFMSGQDHVTVHPFTNPADQKTALLAGSLDMCGTTLAHAIHSASMGQPVVVVAALCNKCSAFVVRKDAEIQTVRDLKGARIGYVPGTMHEILLRETLAQNSLSAKTDVKLMRVDFFDMGLALARGNIDAFLSGEPFPTMAVENGYGKIISYPYFESTMGTINAGMLVTRNFREAHREKVYRLVRAHALASRHLARHQDQWLSRSSDFGVSRKILEKAVSNMELGWDMDSVFIRQVKALGARMEALGMIRRQPDYEQLIDLSFVNRFKAEIGHDK
jgi:NitT/TauT family transport system substrate-binding protein